MFGSESSLSIGKTYGPTMLTRRMSLGQCCASFLLAVLTAALLRTPVAVIAVPVTPAQDVLWQDNSLAPAVSDGENVEFVNGSLEHTMLRGRCEVLCSTSLRNLSAEERQVRGLPDCGPWKRKNFGA